LSLKGLPPAGGQGAEVAMQMARCKHGAARFMNYQKLHQSGLPAALKETLRSSAVGVCYPLTSPTRTMLDLSDESR
jgi:hypothetical protein